MLNRRGTLALRRGVDGYAIVAAIRPRGIDRPWSRAVADDDEAKPPASRPGLPAPPVDATPAQTDLQADD
jgi:competence protein ComEC